MVDLNVSGWLSGFNWSSLMGYIKYGIYIALGLALFNFFLKYRYIIVVRKQRGNSQKITIDFGRRLESKGLVELKMLFNRETIQFPKNTFIYHSIMGMEFIELYKDASNRLHPINFGFAENSPFLYPEEQDHKAWHIIQTRRNQETYAQSFMGKYGMYVGMGAVMVICLITVIMSYEQLDKAFALGNSVIHQAGQVMGSIKAPPIG